MSKPLTTLLSKQLDALQGLSEPLRNSVKQIIEQPHFTAKFTPQQVDTLAVHQPDTPQLLRDLVPLAQTYSHAPISNFQVGAVALGASGTIYLGANIEFVGQTLGQTVHAEQCVITNAWSNDETHFTHLAVSAPPCGHCRQFINELDQAQDINVLLPNQPGIQFEQLLPLSFGPSDLGVSDRLMKSKFNKLSLATSDKLTQLAIKAAKLSYSPYSDSPSGIAIQTKTGQYTGRYAENCAYNPSLAPLQGALINLRLAGDSFDEIKRVVLIEKRHANVSQHAINQKMLDTLGKIDYQRKVY